MRSLRRVLRQLGHGDAGDDPSPAAYDHCDRRPGWTGGRAATSRGQPLISLRERVRSGYLRFWFEVSERLRWSRGPRCETPCVELDGVDTSVRVRVAVLAAHFGVGFERVFAQSTTLANYAYLDLLHRAFAALRVGVPRGEPLQDVGSANFRYAAALHAFFAPRALVGIEVEGYRLLRDGRSRMDYARGYVAGLPDTRFVVADYAGFAEPAGVVTMWFPFVTPGPLLAWRLPLKVFAPGAFFVRAARNLVRGGMLLVVSHGEREADLATPLATAAGFHALGRFRDDEPLVSRPQPAVVTLWRRS